MKNLEQLENMINNSNFNQKKEIYLGKYSFGYITGLLILDLENNDLYLKHPNSINQIAYIHFSLNLEDSRVYMWDNICREEKKGIGSFMLEAFKMILKKMNINTIIGDLSPFDDLKYLSNFYEKRGFQVFFNENFSQGKIKITL